MTRSFLLPPEREPTGHAQTTAPIHYRQYHEPQNSLQQAIIVHSEKESYVYREEEERVVCYKEAGVTSWSHRRQKATVYFMVLDARLDIISNQLSKCRKIAGLAIVSHLVSLDADLDSNI